MPFLTGYTLRKAITIDNANVDSDLTDFPLLVKITSDADIGANIDAGGLNIRFTSSDGETLLKYERQSFSVSGGAATGTFWVKVPTVAGASDTTIYIYYKGGATSDGEDAENVWDSNFVAVWHLDESSGTILDSTANNNDSTATLGTPDYGQAGKVDSAINFQPSECFDIGMATFAASAGTISGWVRTDLASPANNFYWLGRNRSGNFAGDINCFQSSGDLWRFDLQDGTNTRACQSNSAITDGQWYHFVGRWNASETALFIDGVKQTDTDLGIDLPQHASRSLAIGHSSTTHSTADGFAWDGQIDEIRISSTDRSDAWIKFEHANINEADNEISFGAEEEDSGSGSPATALAFRRRVMSGWAAGKGDVYHRFPMLATKKGVNQRPPPKPPPTPERIFVRTRTVFPPPPLYRPAARHIHWQPLRRTDAPVPPTPPDPADKIIRGGLGGYPRNPRTTARERRQGQRLSGTALYVGVGVNLDPQGRINIEGGIEGLEPIVITTVDDVLQVSLLLAANPGLENSTGLRVKVQSPITRDASGVGLTPAAARADSGQDAVTLTGVTTTITDPADTPADADALRDDLVANAIAEIETALGSLAVRDTELETAIETLAAEFNDLLAKLRAGDLLADA